MNNRIRTIITSLKMSDGEFADLVGIKRSTLSHCLSGRNDVSKEIIVKIHKALPDVSINWLMFGEGESGISGTPSNEINEGLFQSVSDFPTINESVSGYSTENNPKLSGNTVESTDNKGDDRYSATLRDLPEIENLPQSKRKIEKIIMFYSDSTFEVFIPDK